MIALLLTIAIGQLEDAAELHERWQIAESIYNEELAAYTRSCREQYEAVQREPNEANKRDFFDKLEAYKREMSPLLLGIRRTVDKMRLKYLRASGRMPRKVSLNSNRAERPTPLALVSYAPSEEIVIEFVNSPSFTMLIFTTTAICKRVQEASTLGFPLLPQKLSPNLA